MTRPIPAALRHGPFSYEQACQLGMTSAILANRRFTRLFPRVYAPSSLHVSHEERCRAALLTAPAGSAICGVAALRLQNLDLPARMAQVETIDILVPNAVHWRPPPGLRTVRTRKSWVRSGELLAGPVIVYLMLGLQSWTVNELVQVGDRMTARQRPLTTRDELLNAARTAVNQRGRRKLIQAAVLIRPGTDSIPETLMRLAMVRDGLPCPAVNHPVRDAQGHPLALIDLAYPDLLIGVEYDGIGHWSSDDQRQRDHARQRLLEASGWRIIRASRYDLHHPTGFLAAVRSAIADRGGQLPAEH